MKKRMVIIISFVVIVMGLLSLYTTFSINKDNDTENTLDSDFGLTYSLKNTDSMDVTINHGEEKYIDMELSNIYSESVKYGVYYIIKEPKNIPYGFDITIDNTSKNSNEELLKPLEEKVVTIKILNNSSYNVTITLGSVVGFMQGDVGTLLNDNMILIK